MKKIKNTKETAVLIKSIEEGLRTSNFNTIDCIAKYVKFTCEKCGKDETKRDVSLVTMKRNNSSLLCGPCLRKLGTFAKHGSETYNNSSKAKQTCFERYGVSNGAKSEEARKKISAKVKITANSEATISKTKATNLKRYGSENVWGANSSCREKQYQTNIERFGAKTYAQSKFFSKNCRRQYVYDDITFDSSWELAFWIYHKDHSLAIEKNTQSFDYVKGGIEHKFFPDFETDDGLIEIKGDHLLSGVYEEQAKTSSKLKCCEQNNIKVLSYEQLKPYLSYIKSVYGAQYLKQFVVKDEKLIDHYVSKCRQTQFPYPKYPTLVRLTDNIIRQYHTSIWHANVKGRLSPYDAWHDDSKLRLSIENRLQYKGKELSFEDIRDGFTVAKIAPRVSLFPSSLAKRLIATYLSDVNEIFDPCSGFSSRLLGTMLCKKSYVGFDINKEHIAESKKIITDFKLKDARVICCDSLQSTGKFESLFTCPPYNDLESWGDELTILSSDEWITYCLNNYKCSKYLFVVKETTLYKNNVVEVITKSSHLSKVVEQVLLL